MRHSPDSECPSVCTLCHLLILLQHYSTFDRASLHVVCMWLLLDIIHTSARIRSALTHSQRRPGADTVHGNLFNAGRFRGTGRRKKSANPVERFHFLRQYSPVTVATYRFGCALGGVGVTYTFISVPFRRRSRGTRLKVAWEWFLILRSERKKHEESGSEAGEDTAARRANK